MSKNTNYPEIAKQAVRDSGIVGPEYELDELYVVMFAYVLGGWKALVSSSTPNGLYWEVTYNKDKGETYVDTYEKLSNVVLYGVIS